MFLSVSSVNRADGNSEIEGKAAKGSGERVGKRSEFQIRGSENQCSFGVGWRMKSEIGFQFFPEPVDEPVSLD
jgi:hypothetical protein